MNLSDIFPENSIRNKFDSEVSVKRLDKRQLKEIVSLKSDCMAEIGGGAWDRYVQKNPDCNPQALAPFFNENSPKIYLAMERHTGLKVLQDIAYITAEVLDDKLDKKQCAELLLAVTWPNVLRISDVTFANPYEPIPEPNRKYRFQYFKGLGLFPELLERCIKYCSEKGITEITLAAAYIDLVPFFESYGFSVEDTPAARDFLDLEEGIPMCKVL